MFAFLLKKATHQNETPIAVKKTILQSSELSVVGGALAKSVQLASSCANCYPRASCSRFEWCA